jgi:hypothetical protein
MTSADDFERAIKKATSKGIGSSFKGPGRTAPIAAALRAYEESGAKNEAQAERAAYLYQVIKNCNAWSQLKAGKTGGNTSGRRRVIVALYNEAQLELRQYPLIMTALDQYARRKAGGPKRQGTGLKDVYAHEGAVYKNLKAQGQFVDAGQPRFAPSATLFHTKLHSDKRAQGTAVGRGEKQFKNLSFEEFMELDRLLASQYQVLYMSKMQRLSYMAAIEDGRFYRATEGSLIDMSGTTVEDDLGQGDAGESATAIFACDRYGGLFVVKNDMKDKDGNSIQLNHSTLLAGNEVLCAGTISIKKGVLKGISNLSGHYRPDTNALKALLRDWQGEDVEIQTVLVLDGLLGIETMAPRYLQGDHTDRGKDRLVQNMRKSRG